MAAFGRRIVMLVLLGFAFSVLAADNAVQFTGHWKLQPEQSEIHPGSQWVTDQLDVRLTGRLLELTEKQSFGADEDLIRRENKSLMLPSSRLTKGRVETVTRWNNGALVERSSFMIGKSRQRVVVQLELTDPDTLIRTTTVRQLEKGRWIVVLYQREFFGRS